MYDVLDRHSSHQHLKDSDYRHALPPDLLVRDYRLVRVLGIGGFGVTYLAEHTTLGHRVAVKEYLPAEFAVRDGTEVHPKSLADREQFDWGLARFVEEARTLTRFRHPNIVRVIDYFELNGTAYIVMEAEDGEPLDRLLDAHGTLSEPQLKRVLLPIVDGVRQLHAAGILHRDIKPANIFVRRTDESPVLLDFGSARQAVGGRTKSLTAVASAGYSPPEQYESDGDQGPWTDIYALAALCYQAITGERPTESPVRMNRLALARPDPVPSLLDLAPAGYSKALLAAVDRGLEVGDDRPRTLDDWIATVADPNSEKPSAPRQGKSRSRHARGRVPSKKSPRKPWLRRLRVAATWTIATVVAAFALLVWLVGGETTSRADAILVVQTVPPGVEVLVDDLRVGETPLERSDLPSGNRTITLSHPFYENQRLADLEFVSNSVLRIERTLVRATGSLTVVTEPRAAWIEIDGDRVARRTPVTLESLPAGALALTLGANGHRTEQVQAVVPKDRIGRFERTLAPLPQGTLTLALDPEDARVTFLGDDRNYAPGMRLPVGTYRIEVAREGFGTATLPVEVVAGDTRVPVALPPMAQPFTVVATPPNAAVALQGIDEPYRPGMLLEPGNYEIDVSSPGYEPTSANVAHDRRPTSHAVVLSLRMPDMVVIPAGSYRRGCLARRGCRDDERPVRNVRIRGFALSKHEISFDYYDAFAHATGRPLPDDEGWGRGDRPAVNVSWQDAAAYAGWLASETGDRYRLPTESEWEYAARAGTETAYGWGDRLVPDRANCDGCGVSAVDQTAPVGTFDPNPWGLHDMHGNVWEWVRDCWNETYRSAPVDGTAWERDGCSRRVLRGGAWLNTPASLRTAIRNRLPPGSRNGAAGFRVARDLEQ